MKLAKDKHSGHHSFETVLTRFVQKNGMLCYSSGSKGAASYKVGQEQNRNTSAENNEDSKVLSHTLV
eukprot:220295-Amphidinium_carterae.1